MMISYKNRVHLQKNLLLIHIIRLIVKKFGILVKKLYFYKLGFIKNLNFGLIQKLQK